MNLLVERPAAGHVLVRPEGRVDADTADRLRDLLLELANESARTVVVDLEAVDFIDSSGLSALVAGFKSLTRSGGTMRLTRPKPQAQTALRLTQLDRVFTIFDSVEEALAADDSVDA